MYTPPMFKPDRAAALAFAEARGFGTVCAWNGKRPIASSLPFYLDYTEDGTPTALFHFARNNPLIKAADGVTPWVLAVLGADAYVTPDGIATLLSNPEALKNLKTPREFHFTFGKSPDWSKVKSAFFSGPRTFVVDRDGIKLRFRFSGSGWLLYDLDLALIDEKR